MKQSIDILNDFYFYLLLCFLFLINFSIAGCYLIFSVLGIVFIVFCIKNKKFPECPGYFKYFLLYILFTLISTIFSLNPLVSIKDNKELVIFLLIPIFILIINSKKRLIYSIFTVLISSLISSFIGIFITLNRYIILKQGPSLDHRLKGITSHWMTYSGLLMLAFVFFFIYFFYEKTKKKKLFIFISLIFILTSILFSLTRSVWIGIIVSLSAFIIYYKPKVLYFAIPIVLVLVIVLPKSVQNRFTSIFDMDNATNKDRIFMYETGFNIFNKYPLFGIGANNLNKKVYKENMPEEAKNINPHLHNNFLQVLIERGIITLISLILAFISIFINLIKKIKNSLNLEKLVPIGVLFVFISFVVAGFFEYNFGDSEIKFFIFYFLSIPFLTLNYKEKFVNDIIKEKVKNND